MITKVPINDPSNTKSIFYLGNEALFITYAVDGEGAYPGGVMINSKDQLEWMFEISETIVEPAKYIEVSERYFAGEFIEN